jgi:hypothetical protein
MRTKLGDAEGEQKWNRERWRKRGMVKCRIIKRKK